MCGAPDSPLGSARAFPPLCFKLRTGFFLLLLGGDQEGAAPPSRSRRCPRVRPARPQPRRQVSESSPRLAWPEAPAPQASASARVRAPEARNPGPRPCAPRRPGPRSPDTSGQALGAGATHGVGTPGGEGPDRRTGHPGRDQGGLDPGTGQRGRPDRRTAHRGGPDLIPTRRRPGSARP